MNTNQCLPAQPDCESFYPNTVAIWDPSQEKYVCDCQPGYVWSLNGQGCEPDQPADCSQYPNTTLVFDPSKNDYVCDCISGYKWNATGTGCVQKADPSEAINAISSIMEALTSGMAGTNAGGRS